MTGPTYPGSPAEPTEPAPPPPPATTGPPTMAAIQSSWRGFGQAERIAAAGGVIAIVAYLAGVLFDGWSLGVSGLAVIIGGLVALAALFVRGSAMLPSVASIRTGAAVVASFALVDLGDLLSSIGDWRTSAVLLTAAYIVGAALLLYGGWQATAGDFVRDVAALGGVMALPLPARLLTLGAAGVLVGWFLLALTSAASLGSDNATALLAATLTLAVLWAERNPSSGVRFPVDASVVSAVLGVVVAVIALLYLIRIADEIGSARITSIVALLVYLAAAAAMAAGAVLILQGRTGARAS